MVEQAGRLWNAALSYARTWMAEYELQIWAGLAAAALLLAVYGIRQRKSRLAYQHRINHMKLTMNSVHPDKSVEHNLNALLEIVGGVVEAASYAFYTYDERNKIYVLKAVRHRAEDFGKIRPSYSGLKPFPKETYTPPLSVSASFVGAKSEIIREGEVPLVQIPIGERIGVIRLGPMGGKLKRGIIRMFDELGSYMQHGVHYMLDKEKTTNQADVVISSGRALQQISNIALDPNVTFDLMLDLSMRTIGAVSGCFVRKVGQRFIILASKELDPDVAARMAEDDLLFSRLHGFVEKHEHVVIRKTDEAFYDLPPYLAATGIDQITATQADGPHEFLVYFYKTVGMDNDDSGRMTTLHMIMGDMRQLIGYQSSLRQLSSTNTNILKKLSQLLDNLSPYTVGYSEQMSRYSIIIGQQLRLPEDVLRDIAMAAYLSNIGVLGISTELYQKEGKYTDKEFEMMKLHAEVGASIVRVTSGNERAASYIMHHHERMDGNGYPSGLKGDEIPVGAKIIAVVQTFLAKINGRPYREPLAFSNALKTLKAASGPQLDSNVVQVFIDWFKIKQADPAFNARSLGSCWEMNCSPSSVCEHCPAYGRTDANCWDIPENNCRAHGKQCESCFVRTEMLTRKEVLSL